jgi:Domain of unknown function (DUF1906)
MRRGAAAVGAAVFLLLAVAACSPVKPPPNGGTGNGFDACAAPSTGTMSNWLQSPYRYVGVYIGGSNRACSQPNLSAAWVNAVHDQGWGLIPTYVGLQAPCAFGNVGPRIDSGNAFNQGYLSAADAAQNDAAPLDLGPGTPIYFDMEAYDNSPSGCSDVVLSFMAGWIQGLHDRGYAAGMYSSSASGVADLAQAQGDPAHQLDAIWFANWNNNPSLFGDPFFSDSVWQNARIHQFRGGHDENWGGETINIDNDQVGGPTG